MAFIEGLDERKAALTRVKDNLKIIKNINNSLSNIETYLSDSVSKKYKMICEFHFKDESLKRISIPVEPDDEKDFIIKSLKKQKETIVKLVKDDATEYHISLTAQEEAMLVSNKNSEN